jgi:hypothetical protein
MEDEVGRACCTDGAERNTERVLEERNQLEDIGGGGGVDYIRLTKNIDK